MPGLFLRTEFLQIVLPAPQVPLLSFPRVLFFVSMDGGRFMGYPELAVNVHRDLIFVLVFAFILLFHRAMIPVLNKALYGGTAACQPVPGPIDH
jgi:hypothetical protein